MFELILLWWNTNCTNYSLMQYKGHNSMRWPFYNHFWPFFCQLHKYLSQNLGSDGHFEEVNMSKSQLNQNLWHKLQEFLTSLFFNFGRKKIKEKCFKNGHFLTICGHFFSNYMDIFHKTETQTVILRCLVCLNINLIKSYDIISSSNIFFMPENASFQW